MRLRLNFSQRIFGKPLAKRTLKTAFSLEDKLLKSISSIPITRSQTSVSKATMSKKR